MKALFLDASFYMEVNLLRVFIKIIKRRKYSERRANIKTKNSNDANSHFSKFLRMLKTIMHVSNDNMLDAIPLATNFGLVS